MVAEYFASIYICVPHMLTMYVHVTSTKNISLPFNCKHYCSDCLNISYFQSTTIDSFNLVFYFCLEGVCDQRWTFKPHSNHVIINITFLGTSSTCYIYKFHTVIRQYRQHIELISCNICSECMYVYSNGICFIQMITYNTILTLLTLAVELTSLGSDNVK